MILHKTLPIFALLFLVGTPDEGQWLPTQIRKMDWKKLRKRGMELTKDEFWHPQKGGVLTASVQLRGCSASFVSADGLVVTNHHCGFSSINALSTPQQNYLRDGFVAKEWAQELPARGMTVQIVRRIEDVTDKMHEAIAKATESRRATPGPWNSIQLSLSGARRSASLCTVTNNSWVPPGSSIATVTSRQRMSADFSTMPCRPSLSTSTSPSSHSRDPSSDSSENVYRPSRGTTRKPVNTAPT